MFLFAAWSLQLLLYFRQSRYYAFTPLSAAAAIDKDFRVRILKLRDGISAQ